MCVCVCVRVRVCARARGRSGPRGTGRNACTGDFRGWLLLNFVLHGQCVRNRVCLCVFHDSVGRAEDGCFCSYVVNGVKWFVCVCVFQDRVGRARTPARAPAGAGEQHVDGLHRGPAPGRQGRHRGPLLRHRRHPHLRPLHRHDDRLAHPQEQAGLPAADLPEGDGQPPQGGPPREADGAHHGPGRRHQDQGRGPERRGTGPGEGTLQDRLQRQLQARFEPQLDEGAAPPHRRSGCWRWRWRWCWCGCGRRGPAGPSGGGGPPRGPGDEEGGPRGRSLAAGRRERDGRLRVPGAPRGLCPGHEPPDPLRQRHAPHQCLRHALAPAQTQTETPGQDHLRGRGLRLMTGEGGACLTAGRLPIYSRAPRSLRNQATSFL